MSFRTRLLDYNNTIYSFDVKLNKMFTFANTFRSYDLRYFVYFFKRKGGISIFNLRLFDYPTGYQIRIYDKVLDTDLTEDKIDCVTGETKPKIKLKKGRDKEVDYPVDVWIPVEKTFEELTQEFDAEQLVKKARSEKSSMNRTINNLYYISRSNVWDYFLTFTLDPNKIDRFDYAACSRVVRKSFNNLKQRKAFNLRYLVVPEQHKNGAWHFHGLLGNTEGLDFVFSGGLDKDNKPIYNLMDYKLGFTTATEVVDSAKVSNYICKYITKSLCSQTKGLQRYYVSKNCHRATIYDCLVDGQDLENFKFSLVVSGCYFKCLKADYVTTYYFEVSDKNLIKPFLEFEEV